MKALGLALLLANVLYLAWLQWLDSDDAAGAATAMPADVPKLVLAREAQSADGLASPGESSESRESGESPAAVAARADESTPDQENALPSARPPVDSGPAQPVELLAGVKRCLSVGPFRDLAEATQGSTVLRTGDRDPRTRVAQGEVWAGLWVYLADVPSRAEAQRALAVLKQRGIRDAYIMPTSERSADISLGIFSEPARAQRRAEEVRALGFTPTIADRTRTGTVYWVDVELGPTEGFIDPSAIPSGEGKISRLEVEACPAADAQSG